MINDNDKIDTITNNCNINCDKVNLKIKNKEMLSDEEVIHIQNCHECSALYKKVEIEVMLAADKTVSAVAMKYNLKSINKRKISHQYAYGIAAFILIISTVSLLIYFSLNYFYFEVSRNFTARLTDFEKNLDKNMQVINERMNDRLNKNYANYISSINKVISFNGHSQDETYEAELFFSSETGEQTAPSSEMAIADINTSLIKETPDDSTELTYADSYFEKYEGMLSENSMNNNSILLADDYLSSENFFSTEGTFYENIKQQ